MPNFAFYGGRRQATTIYLSFWAWIWSLENSTSGGFAYNWQSKWVGIIAIKTERTFLSPSRRWILKSLVPVRGLRGCQAKKPLRTTCNSTLFSTSLRLQLIEQGGFIWDTPITQICRKISVGARFTRWATKNGKLLVAYCKNDCNQKGLLQNCFYLQQISKKQLKLKPNLNSKKFFKIA